MLINLTNHSSSSWTGKQLSLAQGYGSIVDYPFPQVDPAWDEKKIKDEAERIYHDVMATYAQENLTIHIMGEFTLCYALIQLFKANGIKCIASTTERIVTDNPDGTKTSSFKFVQFREY